MQDMDIWLINLEVQNRDLSQDNYNKECKKSRKALDRFNDHYTWAKNLTDSPKMHMEASNIRTQVYLMISRKEPAEAIERYLDQALPKMLECVENYDSRNREYTHFQSNYHQSNNNTQRRITNATTESQPFVCQKKDINSTRVSIERKLNLEVEKGNNLCKRPSISQALNAYDKVSSLEDLTEVAGGKLKQNFDDKSFVNGCSARISFVMEKTGCKVPVIPGKTVSGKNGEQYIFRLSTLEPFLNKAYGPPDCEWRNWRVVGNSNVEKCSSLEGRKGILIERWNPHPHSTCTGHAKLITGDPIESFPPPEGKFWELPDDGKVPNDVVQDEANMSQ